MAPPCLRPIQGTTRHPVSPRHPVTRSMRWSSTTSRPWHHGGLKSVQSTSASSSSEGCEQHISSPTTRGDEPLARAVVTPLHCHPLTHTAPCRTDTSSPTRNDLKGLAAHPSAKPSFLCTRKSSPRHHNTRLVHVSTRCNTPPLFPPIPSLPLPSITCPPLFLLFLYFLFFYRPSLSLTRGIISQRRVDYSHLRGRR